MPVVLGVDIGTTTITVLALDTEQGNILASRTVANQAETTSAADKARGRSEWDARRMIERTCGCVRQVAEQLGPRLTMAAGIGITGQQHGVVVVDGALTPLTPFINWQDRRAEEIDPATQKTYVRDALDRAGEDGPRRAGCRLAPGYMGITLFWMKRTGMLPAGTACFLMDYFAAALTGQAPVTDPTCAASSGLLDVGAGDWDTATIAALDLPRSLFPEVRTSGDRVGVLTAAMARTTALPAGLPLFVGIGDNQASFLGSVARREESVLVNVGTGGQVAAFTERFVHDPLLEIRPFPRGGYLLVSAGLCGGGSYAVLERFFRDVGDQVLGTTAGRTLFARMNELAARVPGGADGLRCVPLFTGTRAQPEVRASWTGVSAQNFTPAHMTRALLEGMARAFHGGYQAIVKHLPQAPRQLMGAGNGLRENRVLEEIVAEEFGMPVRFAHHREEAAFGAALLATVGAGIFPDLSAAGRLVRHA